MNFTAQYSNLETIVPTTDIDPAHINPGQKPPSSFMDQPWPGGTIVSIVGPEYSAGMSKRQQAVLPGLLSGQRQIKHSLQIRTSETALLYSQVDEMDLRPVDAAGYLYPGDVQKDYKGAWYFSKDGNNWTPTGFIAPIWTPDVWTPVVKIYEVDFTKRTIALMSIKDGAQLWNNPSPLAVPAIGGLGWPVNFFYMQDQKGRNGVVGEFGYQCSARNISISMQ